MFNWLLSPSAHTPPAWRNVAATDDPMRDVLPAVVVHGAGHVFSAGWIKEHPIRLERGGVPGMAALGTMLIGRARTIRNRALPAGSGPDVLDGRGLPPPLRRSHRSLVDAGYPAAQPARPTG